MGEIFSANYYKVNEKNTQEELILSNKNRN